MHAPAYQMSKLIYKRYAVEALAQSMVLLKKQSQATSTGAGSFEKSVMSLIYFCSIQKTIKMANYFRLCTQSLKLVQDMEVYGLSIKYDFGYICQTCTLLL